MTIWLFDIEMEVSSHTFSLGDEYSVSGDDTVYVQDTDSGAIVGPFELLTDVPDLSPPDDPETERIRIRESGDQLFLIDDDSIVGDLEPPQVTERKRDLLERAEEYVGTEVTYDSFLTEGGEDEDDSQSHSSEQTEPDGVSLQDIFNRQRGIEDEDFAGQTVLGNKELADTTLSGCRLSDTELSGVTFRDVNLRDADFRGADLQNVEFVGRDTQLGGADFTGATLSGAKFETAVSECIFAGAQMRGVDLRKASLEGADFSEARLKRAKLHQSEPERATFDRAVLQDVKTSGATFSDTSFVGADISNTRFTDVDFDSVDFTDADLHDATFEDCDLNRVDFAGADLSEVTLADHETKNLDFERANLTDATLNETEFESARFTDARLTRAKFVDCNLSGVSLASARADNATFNGANLEYATLAQADLTGATFTAAKLYTCQLSSARVGPGQPFDDVYDYRENTIMDESGSHAYSTDDETQTHEEHPGRLAAAVYRSIEAVYRDNSLTEESLRYHRLRKDANYESNKDDGQIASVFVDGFLKYTTSHGTRLAPLATLSGILVAVIATVHFVFGTLQHESLGRVWILAGPEGVAGVGGILQALLFTALTFSGLGYGPMRPTSLLGGFIAASQTAFGVLFFGLLVFVLSTRASR